MPALPGGRLCVPLLRERKLPLSPRLPQLRLLLMVIRP